MSDSEVILRTMAFRELALRFLDSCNPMPELSIVIANAILDCPPDRIDPNEILRHQAHDFTTNAVSMIEYGNDGDGKYKDFIKKWFRENYHD